MHNDTVMSTPFDVRQWAARAGIQTTGGFAVVAECVTLDELQRFADIAIAAAAKHWQRAHAVAALAEPVQPVAWIYQNANTDTEYLVWKRGEGGRNWRPLYTAPPQRKPLAEEDLRRMWAAYAPIVGGVIDFARAVERAHGIIGGEE